MFYTIIFQHNTSKDTYSFILEDLTPESIYHKFEIELEPDMLDGEYEWLLIPNPNKVEIEIDINNIFRSQLIGAETEYESFGLMKIGDGKCQIAYDKQQKYTVYNG